MMEHKTSKIEIEECTSHGNTVTRYNEKSRQKSGVCSIISFQTETMN